MEKLAISGGSPLIQQPLKVYRSIQQPEIDAVVEVMKRGVLSGFYGSWSDEFYGGPVVQAFEAAWSKQFQVKYAVSVNSATSGLIAAMGAIGLQAGDEVIVPPLTMSATVMAPLFYGGIPRFVDIDSETFCLEPGKVEAAITPKTKAILAVNLFGHPAPLLQLRDLADKYGLYLIEDNAQSPLAKIENIFAGTVGDIGIFSLNSHKHIHTGEGGMCVTSHDDLAQRLQLIRNHGENVVEDLNLQNITNLIGFNFRLTEIQAAIGLEQLKRIDWHVKQRQKVAISLNKGIANLPGLTPPLIKPDCEHVFYIWATLIDEDILGISREMFSKALLAEGFLHFTGYVKPLYYLPVFQQKKAFDSHPFHLTELSYGKGLCPIAEKLHHQTLLCFEPCAYDLSESDIEQLIQAIHKVYYHREQLKTDA